MTDRQTDNSGGGTRGSLVRLSVGVGRRLVGMTTALYFLEGRGMTHAALCVFSDR